MTATPTAPLLTKYAVSRSGRRALKVIALHCGLLAAFGQAYGKQRIPLGVAESYPTEIVLGLCLFLALPDLWRRSWDRIAWASFALCMLAAGWVLAYGLGATAAGPKAFSFFVYAGFYYVVRAVAVDDGARKYVINAIAVGTLGAVVVAAYVMLTDSTMFKHAESADEFRRTATGSTRWIPGEYCVYGSFAIIIASAERLVTRRGSRRATMLWVSGLILLILSQHRSTLVQLLVAFVCMLMLLPDAARALSQLLKLLAVTSICLATYILFFGGDYFSDTIARLQTTTDLSEDTAAWRLLNWAEVWMGIQSEPLGHGFAKFDFRFTLLDPLIGSHNSYLDFTYRVGVPGFLLLVTILLMHLQAARRQAKLQEPGSRVLLLTIVGCFIALLGNALLNMVFEIPYLSVFFWILLGLGPESRRVIYPWGVRTPTSSW